MPAAKAEIAMRTAPVMAYVGKVEFDCWSGFNAADDVGFWVCVDLGGEPIGDCVEVGVGKVMGFWEDG